MNNSAKALFLLGALTAFNAASAAEPNIIRMQAPIREGNAAQAPAEPEDPTKAFYITVGYHPNGSCSYKMRGYGKASVCSGVSGSYGSISNTAATISGKEYEVRQIMGWKSGTACIYSFMVSGASLGSMPTTLHTTWNGQAYDLVKSSRASPLVTWDLNTSCDLYNSLGVGNSLKVVLKES